MNKLILAVGVLCIVSCATNRPDFIPYSDSNELSLKNVLKNVNYKKDEFKKHIFITPKSRFSEPLWKKEVNLKPYIALNYAQNSKSPIGRLTVSLEKNGWLFMSYIHFMCGSESLKIHMNHADINREVVYGAAIREHYDHALSKNEFEFLKECKASDKYRLYGKASYMEKSFKPEEITYFQEIALVAKEIKANGYRSIAKAKENSVNSQKP